MTPDKDTIRHLNAVLKNKLTAISQYFLHARMLKHGANMELADYEYKASIGAMKHADMLVEHILSLGGLPALHELDPLAIGETGDDMLRCDLALAESGLRSLAAAVACCEARADQPTARLLARISDNEKEHVDFIHDRIGATV